MTDTTIFEEQREHLAQLAYRMLGSVADAEDIVQETFVRWHGAGQPELDSPRAWFTQTCTRLCIDVAKSARRSRELYVGEWLPEPLAPSNELDDQIFDDTLSMALLRTIQQLGPSERAAFLLHDVFGYGFAEVAEVLGRKVATCRQLAVRARQRLSPGGARSSSSGTADQEAVERITHAFFAAVGAGDLDGIRDVLAEDVALHSDGGGQVPAARQPIHGRRAVARFFHRIFPAGSFASTFEVRAIRFNGSTGIVLLERGVLVSAFQLQVVDEQITSIHVQRNPGKLLALKAHLAASTEASARRHC